MIILRLVLLVFTPIMTVVTLVIGVSVMLMEWLAVAVPVLVVLGLSPRGVPSGVVTAVPPVRTGEHVG